MAILAPIAPVSLLLAASYHRRPRPPRLAGRAAKSQLGNGKRFLSPDGTSWLAIYRVSAGKTSPRPITNRGVPVSAEDETITYLRGERTWPGPWSFRVSKTAAFFTGKPFSLAPARPGTTSPSSTRPSLKPRWTSSSCSGPSLGQHAIGLRAVGLRQWAMTPFAERCKSSIKFTAARGAQGVQALGSSRHRPAPAIHSFGCTRSTKGRDARAVRFVNQGFAILYVAERLAELRPQYLFCA